MGHAKVYLSVALLSAILGYFTIGPVFAAGIAVASLLPVLIWDNLAPGIVLRSVKATRMTDAWASSNVIYRLFLGDVRQLTEAAGMRPVQMFLVDTYVPLAFSMGTANGGCQIIVTSGLFKVLTRLEVSAVIGHELGHLRAGDSALNAIRLSLSLILSRLFLRPVMAPFLKLMSYPKLLSRVMLGPECRADAFSASLCKDGRILASALKKLERGVRAVQWSALDQLPFLAQVSVVDPFAAQKSDAEPQYSRTAHRVAELNRIELPKAA